MEGFGVFSLQGLGSLQIRAPAEDFHRQRIAVLPGAVGLGGVHLAHGSGFPGFRLLQMKS